MLPKWPHTLYDGPLLGDTPLRYVYVDEAGTSAREPVSIVTGVIVDADRHWRVAHDRVQALLDEFVPADRRENFIFHAKQIWGDEKVRPGWPDQDRHSLLHGMMRVPYELGLAVSIGVVRRNPSCFESLPDKGARFSGKISPSQWEHFLAFSLCLEEADRYIRTYGHDREVGTVVAENVPEIINFLGAGPDRRCDGHLLQVSWLRRPLPG
jgi:hypothetical protein